MNDDVRTADGMAEVTVPAGTLVHTSGLPYLLVEETKLTFHDPTPGVLEHESRTTLTPSYRVSEELREELAAGPPEEPVRVILCGIRA